jgi:hypothetical protein
LAAILQQARSAHSVIGEDYFLVIFMFFIFIFFFDMEGVLEVFVICWQ